MDIVWTAGATEAVNTVVHHFAAASAGEAWVSAVEHPCVLAAVKRWFPGRHQFVPATRDGLADLGWLDARLRRARPAFVAVMAANNETGVLQPWPEMLALCRAAETPFVCDAAQWIGRMRCRGLGDCDFVIGCAHKFGGPAGVGFLKCPANLRPLLVGGPQESGRRAGTENVAGVWATAAALAEAEAALARGDGEDGRRRRDAFEEELLRTLPETHILGGKVPRLWNTAAALMPPLDCNQRWVVRLDKLGFAVSTGSACSSGKAKPSHVLAAMGYTADEAARMLRFSAAFSTTAEEWGGLNAGLVRAATELQTPRPAPARAPTPPPATPPDSAPPSGRRAG